MLELPDWLINQYESLAQSEREAGGRVEINPMLPTISVYCSDSSEYYFQEEEAQKLLDQVPLNIKASDFILAQSIHW